MGHNTTLDSQDIRHKGGMQLEEGIKLSTCSHYAS